jgi:hypothetical protein
MNSAEMQLPGTGQGAIFKVGEQRPIGPCAFNNAVSAVYVI